MGTNWVPLSAASGCLPRFRRAPLPAAGIGCTVGAALPTTAMLTIRVADPVLGSFAGIAIGVTLQAMRVGNRRGIPPTGLGPSSCVFAREPYELFSGGLHSGVCRTARLRRQARVHADRYRSDIPEAVQARRMHAHRVGGVARPECVEVAVAVSRETGCLLTSLGEGARVNRWGQKGPGAGDRRGRVAATSPWSSSAFGEVLIVGVELRPTSVGRTALANEPLQFPHAAN